MKSIIAIIGLFFVLVFHNSALAENLPGDFGDDNLRISVNQEDDILTVWIRDYEYQGCASEECEFNVKITPTPSNIDCPWKTLKWNLGRVPTQDEVDSFMKENCLSDPKKVPPGYYCLPVEMVKEAKHILNQRYQYWTKEPFQREVYTLDYPFRYDFGGISR